MPTTPENRAAWGWHERMYPACWPKPVQLRLPLALPEQRRTHDPVPTKLVRMLLHKSPVEAR